jgi:hypothetical protein
MVSQSSQWLCRCDCGAFRYVFLSSLTSGNGKSCGCLARDILSAKSTTHGHTTKGKMSREYISWRSMHGRCRNPNDPHYHNYGGRGIMVCEEWFDFQTFLTDMGPRPLNHSLERKEVDLGYCKSNCIWATPKIQGNNTRSNVRYAYLGFNRTIPEWSDATGVTSGLLYNRIYAGWTIQKAIETPVRSKSRRR